MFTQLKTLMSINVLWLLIGIGAAQAAPGDIDPAFGVDGLLSTNGTPMTLPDGRFAVGNRVDGGFEVRMFTADGAPDTSYGEQGVAFVALANIEDAFTAQGVVSATGELAFYGYRPRTENGTTTYVAAVLKFDATGHPDPAFGTGGDGIVVVDGVPAGLTYLSSLAFQSDGSLLVAAADYGWWDACADAGAVTRLLPNGVIDPAFGQDGWTTFEDGAQTCYLNLLGQRADGTILLLDNGERLLALGPDGVPATGFGNNGQASDFRYAVDAVLLPDGGVLLAGDSGTTRLYRLDGTGQPDPGFGNGGTLELATLRELALDTTDGRDDPRALRLAPDGQSVWLKVDLSSLTSTSPAYRVCAGIAHLSLDGALDPTFGTGGISCLRGVSTWGLEALASGAPLTTLTADGGYTLIRLMLDDRPSPGIVGISPDPNFIYTEENSGSVTLTVSRTGGRDGALSIDYATAAGSAVSGSDFTAASGRLEWADGEDGDRTVAITIVDDGDREGASLGGSEEEYFRVTLAVAAGDALLPVDSTRVYIIDNDPSSPTPVPPVQPASGGGGATSWTMLVTLLGLLGVRRVVQRSPGRSGNNRIERRFWRTWAGLWRTVRENRQPGDRHLCLDIPRYRSANAVLQSSRQSLH